MLVILYHNVSVIAGEGHIDANSQRTLSLSVADLTAKCGLPDAFLVLIGSLCRMAGSVHGWPTSLVIDMQRIAVAGGVSTD